MFLYSILSGDFYSYYIIYYEKWRPGLFSFLE